MSGLYLVLCFMLLLCKWLVPFRTDGRRMFAMDFYLLLVVGVFVIFSSVGGWWTGLYLIGFFCLFILLEKLLFAGSWYNFCRKHMNRFGE